MCLGVNENPKRNYSYHQLNSQHPNALDQTTWLRKLPEPGKLSLRSCRKRLPFWSHNSGSKVNVDWWLWRKILYRQVNINFKSAKVQASTISAKQFLRSFSKSYTLLHIKNCAKNLKQYIFANWNILNIIVGTRRSRCRLSNSEYIRCGTTRKRTTMKELILEKISFTPRFEFAPTSKSKLFLARHCRCNSVALFYIFHGFWLSALDSAININCYLYQLLLNEHGYTDADADGDLN